jgi:RNA polymerase sigma-70 factor (TIGR02960 family)
MPLTEAQFAGRTDRYRHELHVHCYRMLGSFDEAEDLVQDTLLRAWRRRDDLERVDNPRAWLYKIATNACLDAIKARQRRVPSLASFKDVPWLEPYPDRLLDQAAPVAEEPDAAMIGRETIELTFLAVIQLLPPAQRAALVLRDVLDWPVPDVAELLELSPAAVNSALQRARATLRKHLPTERREDWDAPALSAAEHAVLAGYVAAHESGDLKATLALITDDIRITMPPAPYLYEGRDGVQELVARAAAFGEWRLLPVRANRQPAAACYIRRPGETGFTAFKLDVLRVVDGKVAEITTFGVKHFPAFDLPAALS